MPPEPTLRAIRGALTKLATAEEHLVTTVATARTHGASWAQIGATLGVTRQAAWERFHDHVPREAADDAH